MKPEDRVRLNAAIEYAETVVGSTHNIYEMRWMRSIIDEQAAEIARLETQSENQARIIDTQRRLAQCGESKFEAENETLKEQLAEERAKLKAVAMQLPGSGQVTDIDSSLSDLLGKVADYRAREGSLKSRADKAERELAEERKRRRNPPLCPCAQCQEWNCRGCVNGGAADCCAFVRAETAEARATSAERELERWRHGGTIEGDVVCPNELRAVNAESRVGEYLVAVSKAVYPGATKHPAFDSSWILTELANTLENYRERVAELQALVDTATAFEVQGVRLHKRRGDGKWDVAVDDGSGSRRNEEPLTHLLDALAFARDLAAGMMIKGPV